MFLGGSQKTAPQPGKPQGNPFAPQVAGSLSPAGAGVGAAAGSELFTDALARRRRWSAHALGDTPQRDGPFTPAAAVAAVDYPLKARQEVRKRTSGLNPFDPKALVG